MYIESYRVMLSNMLELRCQILTVKLGNTPPTVQLQLLTREDFLTRKERKYLL